MTRPADLQLDAGAGLSTTEARLRLSKIGANEPVSSRGTLGLVQILLLFINPLAIILLVASAISAAVGEVLNASIIALMVLLSAALNFVQSSALRVEQSTISARCGITSLCRSESLRQCDEVLLMGTSSNFGNMFSMAVASLVPAVFADAADARFCWITFSTIWPRLQFPQITSTGHLVISLSVGRSA